MTEPTTRTLRLPTNWEKLELGQTISFDGPGGYVDQAQLVGLNHNWLSVSLPDGSPARTFDRINIRPASLRIITHDQS